MTRYPWLAFAVIATLLVLHAQLFLGYAVDDAFITLRYADNLRHGLGLTFNPGERVEGFTCPLFVVIEAGLLALGANGVVAAKLLGIACGIGTIGLTMRLALRLTNSVPAAALAGLTLAVQPAFAVACVNGLETALFAFWIAAAFDLWQSPPSERTSTLLGATLAAAFLTRPEGALATAIIGADFLRRKRPLTRFVASFLLIAGPLFLRKAAYYHSWTPNTALAKLPPLSWMRIRSGFAYVADFSETHWEIVGYAALLWLAIRRREPFISLVVFAFVWLGYVVFTGGDWIPRGRFLIPTLPLLAVGLAAGVQSVRWVGQWIPFAFAGLAVLLTGWMDLRVTLPWVNSMSLGTVRARGGVAEWLKAAVPPDTVIATLDVGLIAYETGMRVIDTGGLTDTAIARVIHDHPGVYTGHLIFPDNRAAEHIAHLTMAHKPDVLVLHVRGELPKMSPTQLRTAGLYPQDQALLDDKTVRREYRWVCSNLADKDSGEEHRYNVLVRMGLPLRTQPSVDSEGHVACF